MHCVFFIPSITLHMPPAWETWCCDLNFSSLQWCFLLKRWKIFLYCKGNNSAWIAPVLLWIQSSTVASSCVLPSAPLTWSYPWASWCLAPMLFFTHLLHVCVVWMALDMLLSSWINYLHDIHLPGNPYWCSGQLWLVAPSGFLSCLDCGIEWLSCS